jgi:hypothetical protein
MFSGVQKSISRNRKRLSVIAAVAITLLVASMFVDQMLSPSQEAAAEKPKLAATHVAKTEIADTQTGRVIATMLEDDSYQKALPEKLNSKKTAQQKMEPWPAWVISLIKVILVTLGIATIVLFIWIVAVGSQGSALAQKPRENFKRPVKGPAQAKHHMLIPTATMADVEKMAADGLYGEAVRMLLSIMLIKLAAQDLVRILPSMTGREIVANATIATTAVASLKLLVSTVESYAFAGQAVDRTLFEDCLKNFRLLSSLKENM